MRAAACREIIARPYPLPSAVSKLLARCQVGMPLKNMLTAVTEEHYLTRQRTNSEEVHEERAPERVPISRCNRRMITIESAAAALNRRIL